MAQTTHVVDSETHTLRQVVTGAQLREILDADGDTYDRPSDFGPDDEWTVDEN